MKCLLVVDVQNAFVTNVQLKALVHKIASHIDSSSYDYVCASYCVNGPGSPFTTLLHWGGCLDVSERAILDLIRDRTSRIYSHKGYSCLTDAFKSFMASNGIDELYICGLDTDACVLSTCFDAFNLGIDFKVLYSLCDSSGGSTLHESALKIMQRQFGKDRIIL